MRHLLARFIGPMFVKEMVEMARRKRYYFNRFLYGLVLLLTLFIIWDEYRSRLEYRGGGDLIRAQAAMAEALFHAVSCVQFAAVLLFVPLFLCGVIASKREDQTLDLLFTTHLTDREIVLGKLGSRVAALVWLIFAGLPVLSLLMLFGGVDPISLAQIMAATLAAILFAGAHAIYFSVVTKSAIGALVRTYWWLAVWLIFVPLAGGFCIVSLLDGLTRTQVLVLAMLALGACTFVNPLGPFVIALEPTVYGEIQKVVASLVGVGLAEWFFPATLVLPAVWSVFLIWRAIVRLRGGPIPFVTRRGKVWPIRSLQKFLLRPMRAFGWVDDTVLGAPARWLWREVRNPLWQRSRWARVYDRERSIGHIQWAGWLMALFFIGLLAVVAPQVLEREGGVLFLPPTWLAVAALTAIFAGTSLVGDRRRGFLDQLLVTPLTAREVIDGTLLAVWEHMRRSFWLAGFLGLFFLATGESHPVLVVCSFVTALLTCALIAVHGVLCSLTARTIQGALVPTFVFPLLITAGTGMFVALLEDGNGPALWALSAILFAGAFVWVRRSMSAPAVSCFYTAVYLVLACLTTCWTIALNHREMPVAAMNPACWIVILLERNPPDWGPNNDTWIIAPCYWAALVVTLVWGRWWMIRNFDRLVGRSDQQVAIPARPALQREKVLVPVSAAIGADLEQVTPRYP